LYNDSISFLPKTIGKASALETLVLDKNQITKLPDSFYNLLNLNYCSLEDNLISFISEEAVNFQELYEWNLKGNALSDEQLDILRILLPKCKIIY